METYVRITNGDINVAKKLKEIFTPDEGKYEVWTTELIKRIYDDVPNDDDMDYASIESFACFAFGKKILLTEKWESLRESVSGNLTYINLEKITMTNGVSYITIV